MQIARSYSFFFPCISHSIPFAKRLWIPFRSLHVAVGPVSARNANFYKSIAFHSTLYRHIGIFAIQNSHQNSESSNTLVAIIAYFRFENRAIFGFPTLEDALRQAKPNHQHTSRGIIMRIVLVVDFERRHMKFNS